MRVVYCASSDGFVYAVEGKSGTLRCKANVAPHVYYSPAVGIGMVYVGSAFDSFYALEDATTGDARWAGETGDSVLSSPAVNAQHGLLREQ